MAFVEIMRKLSHLTNWKLFLRIAGFNLFNFSFPFVLSDLTEAFNV